MKKSLLLICILLSFIFNQFLFSQITPFSKVIYDELNTSIQAYDMAKTVDGEFIIVGESLGQNGLVIKIDSVGNPLWNKNFFTPSRPMKFIEIANTSDSCFVIGGEIFNSESNNWDIYLMKINTNGGYVWINSFGVSDGYPDYITSVTETSDSGFMITGYTYEHDQTPMNQILVIKANSGGELEWSRKYKAGNNINKAYSIKEMSSGDFLISGYFRNLSDNKNNAFIMNILSTGEVNWAQKYYLSGNINTAAYDITETYDGFIALMDVWGKSTVMKVDFNGNYIWGKNYNYESNYFGQTPRINQTSDSSFVFVSGQSFGYYTKIDLDGNILQTANLMINPEDIIEVKDKGLLILGNGPLMGVKSNQAQWENIGIIQIDSLGIGVDCIGPINNNYSERQIFNTSLNIITELTGYERYEVFYYSWQFLDTRDGCVDVIGEIEEIDQSNNFSVFPNPNNGQFTMESKESIDAEISLRNSLGEVIHKSNIVNGHKEIDISVFSSGVYFYTITNKDGFLEQGKLVKE